MHVFLRDSGTNGYTRWSGARQREIGKDAGAGDRVIGADPDLDGRVITIPERPHRPWLVLRRRQVPKQIVIALEGLRRPTTRDSAATISGESYGPSVFARGVR
jgi:hypothetical protein